MNKFFRSNRELYRETPRRAYARLDRVENKRALFEIIDADWLDRSAENPTWPDNWRELSTEAPIAVLEIAAAITTEDSDDEEMPSFRIFNSKGVMRALETRSEQAWFEVQLDEASDNAILYTNLFASGRPVGLVDINAIAGKMRRELDAVFAIDEYISTEAELWQALTNLLAQSAIEWVVVYDVGQGSANGICDGAGMPLAYADLGGGVLGNQSTVDPRLSALCFTHQPPIILSHWDWDHWSSGMRFTRSQMMDWIVPLQSLGAVHSAFAHAVAQNGHLKVWPQHLQSLQIGQTTIRKCSGNGRNHSGLSVEVEGPQKEPSILLPGDARYNIIPQALQTRWHAVVVPHHGADMRNTQVPLPASSTGSRAAYSCGRGNSYNHPRAVTEENHDKQRWLHSTLGSTPAMERRTDLERSPVALGHIGLGWRTGSTSMPMPCAGLCSLGFSTS